MHVSDDDGFVRPRTGGSRLWKTTDRHGQSRLDMGTRINLVIARPLGTPSTSSACFISL